MKYHRLGHLHKRNLFLTVLEAWKFKTEVLDDWVLAESLSGCQMATILLCLDLVKREIWRNLPLLVRPHSYHTNVPPL